MTICCTECSGEEFLDTTLQGGPDGQEVLEYVCVTGECDGRGRVVYDYTADHGERRLEGDIEEVER